MSINHNEIVIFLISILFNLHNLDLLKNTRFQDEKGTISLLSSKDKDATVSLEDVVEDRKYL